MAPKKDIGWEHAAPVGGDKKTVQCDYCRKVIRGGITRLKQHVAHIAGQVEGCPRAPPDVTLTLKKHLNDGKSKRATVKKRKEVLVDEFSQKSLWSYMHVNDDDSDVGEDELSHLEEMQLKLAVEESRMALIEEKDRKNLKLAVEESRCMALIEEKDRKNLVSRALPVTVGCSRSLYNEANVNNCDDDDDDDDDWGDVDEKGLSDLEVKQLKQALQESRSMAFLEAERHKSSVCRAYPAATSWTGNCCTSSSYSGKDGTEQPGMAANSGTSSAEANSMKKLRKMQQIRLQIKILKHKLDCQTRKMHLAEQGNAQRKEDLVHIQNELKHQTAKDREESQAEIQHKTLLIEKEQLIVQIDGLKRKLAEKDDELQDTEALNQILILKERSSNLELQDARKELTTVLPNLLDRTRIGVKRMGEVDQRPFQDVGSKKFSSSDWEFRSMETISFWQEKVNNPSSQPFKRTLKDGKWQEIIDKDDSELKGLRHDWGEAAYNAVVNALLELNEYNPSGRYVVPELWNFREGRKASLLEVIQCMTQELRNLKAYDRRR